MESGAGPEVAPSRPSVWLALGRLMALAGAAPRAARDHRLGVAGYGAGIGPRSGVPEP